MKYFSYSSVYYSFYCFYRSKWAGKQEAAHIWAVSSICFWENLVILSADLLLKRMGFPNLYESKVIPNGMDAYILVLAAIVLFNFFYFFFNGRSEKIVHHLNDLPNNVKLKSFLISGCIIFSFFIFSIYQILKFES